MTQENVLYVFVGSTYVSTRPANDGEVAIEFEDGTFGDGTGGNTSGDNFRLVKMNSRGVLEHSPWITAGTALKYNVSGWEAAVQDEWVVQCENTPAEGTTHSLWVVIHDALTTFGNKSMMKNGVYKSNLNDDASHVGAGIAATFNAAMDREPERYVVCSNNAGVLTFTGQPRTNFKPGIWRDFTYTIDVLPGNAGNVSTHTQGKPGKNTENQIKEREWFAQGNRGYGYRVDTIPVDSQLTSQAIYDVLVASNGQKHTYFKFKDQGFTNIVGQSPASLIEISTYLPDAESTKFNLDLAAAFAG